MLHSFPIRIYYEDTDAAGIVYYANYLKFAERARTEALRQAGFDQSKLLAEQKIGFVVKNCNIDFLSPAKLDDLLTIETNLHDISKVSLSMKQVIKNGNKTLVNLDVKLVMVDDKMKLVKLPETIKISLIKAFNPKKYPED